MKVLFKYWYVILVSMLLSMGAAVGTLFLRQSSWMPPPEDPLAEKRSSSSLANMSSNYLEWNFEISKLEELEESIRSERELIEKERQELDLIREQVNQEIAEMVKLRSEIDEVRKTVDEEFLKIEASEEANLKHLAKVYGAMKPVPVIELFKAMDIELIVKIMSVMPAETAAGILEQMTEDRNDEKVIENAVLITEKLRKIRE